MRRFVVRVILISLLATALWWVTAPLAKPTTIALAKWLHKVVGYPTPYLLADLDDYHWFAPLFPPLVGLMINSTWRSWSQRAIGLVLGLVAFWYLVAVQIAVVYSPYLTLSAERAYLMTVQVTLNSVVVPVVLWLILAGPPPRTEIERAPNQKNSPWTLRSLLATLAFCAILTAPIALAGAQTTPTLSAARRDAARAIAGGQPVSAIPHIERMLSIQGDKNAALSYLQFRILDAAGDAEAARRVEPRALTTSKRRSAFRAPRDSNK